MLRLSIFCIWFFLLASLVSARTWTSSSGTYRVEADFIELKGGKVVLKKKDGQTISVPLGKLSKADRAFVAKQTAKKPAGKVKRPSKKPVEKKQPKIHGGEAAIRKGLAKTLPLEFIETPLSDAIAFLRDVSRTEIVLDRYALERADISADAPVSANKKRVTLREALDLILEPLKLTWDVKHEVILVTTEEQHENNLLAVVYQVAPKSDVEALLENIETTVAPKSWDVAGGPGVIVDFGRALVVNQTRQVHRQITKTYGKHLRPLPRTSVTIPHRELKQEAKLQFKDKSLQEVLGELKKRYKLAIDLDKTALEEIGIGADTSVTFDVEGVSLRSALDLMLMQIDTSLTWTLNKQRVIITTREAAEKKLIPSIYNVRDLSFRGDLEPLMEVLLASVAPDSWDENGGPAALGTGPAAGTLAIAQTVQVHLEIDRLLRDLRKLGK